MRGLTGLIQATLLLAPALATIVVNNPFESQGEIGTSVAVRRALVKRSVGEAEPQDIVSSVYITFNVPPSSEETSSKDYSLHFQVLESEEACGYANIKVNSQSLSQGTTKQGHGTLDGEKGSTFVASWNVTCIEDEEGPSQQLVSFSIDMLSGESVEELRFDARFQQTKPANILEINGPVTVSMTLPDGTKPRLESEEDSAQDLEEQMLAELDELEYLRTQLAEIEDAIQMKEQYLAEAYGISASKGMKDCDSLKCVVTSLFDKITGAASHLYDAIEGHDHKHPHKKPGCKFPHFRWPHHGNHSHHGHGNHTHGNHTWPHPPHKPHWKPPFCHCAPPKFPHHRDPHHGPGHGPEKPGHGPPHDKPDDGPHHPPHRPEHGPPDGPHEPHQGPSDGPPPRRPGNEQVDVADPQVELTLGSPGTVSLRPETERPMVADDGARRIHHPHHRRPGPESHGHGPDSPGHHGPRIPLSLKLIGIVFVLFSLIGMCHHRCRHTRSERRALRHARRNARLRRRAERFNNRIRRRMAVKMAVKGFFSRIFGRSNDDDEEKQAMFAERRRRIESERRERETASEGELSTTMEQEIEQFRHAASLVDDMVAAEEGRARLRGLARRELLGGSAATEPRMPPSPTTAFSGYMSDESLPAYDDGESLGSSVVTDGFRYTPGTSAYTPSEYSSSRYTPSAPSEPGSGINEVLGQPKN